MVKLPLLSSRTVIRPPPVISNGRKTPQLVISNGRKAGEILLLRFLIFVKISRRKLLEMTE